MRWLRAVPVPTGRFVAVAAALSIVVVALPLSTRLSLLIVNALLAAVAVADSRLAPAPAALDLVRRFPDVIPLGQQAELAWRIENPTARPRRVEVADDLAPSLRVAPRRSLAATFCPPTIRSKRETMSSNKLRRVSGKKGVLRRASAAAISPKRVRVALATSLPSAMMS